MTKFCIFFLTPPVPFQLSRPNAAKYRNSKGSPWKVALHLCQFRRTLAYKPLRSRRRFTIFFSGAHSAKVELCTRASIRLACFAPLRVHAKFQFRLICTVWSNNSTEPIQPLVVAVTARRYAQACNYHHLVSVCLSVRGECYIVSKRLKISNLLLCLFQFLYFLSLINDTKFPLNGA